MESDVYKCIKLSLTQVIKDENALQKIIEVVERANRIWRRAIHLLKVYILEDIHRCSEINTDFLDLFLQSVCEQPSRGKKASTNLEQKRNLVNFYQKYEDHFEQYLPDLSYKHLSTVLDYMSVSWMTAIENNIKMNYVSYVESYVNFCYKSRSVLRDLKNDKSKNKKQKLQEKREFLRRLRWIKNDILNVNNESLTSLLQDRDFVTASKQMCLPNKASFEKDLVYYDVQVNPIQYLPPLIRITKSIEDASQNAVEKPRLKNVLPSRNSLTSKHIRIDTITLMNMFKYNTSTSGKVKDCQDMIWDDLFRTERKCFKMKSYRFNNSIVTDGVSCTLLFIREDRYGKRCSKRKIIPQKETYLEDICEISEAGTSNDTELVEKCRVLVEDLKNRNVVGTDPNMGNLIYCTDERGRKFRYTQGQRKHEVKMLKHTEFRESLMDQQIEGRTAKEWENILSKHDSKTLNLEKYLAYLRDRYMVDDKLKDIYENEQLKKKKLHAYRNRKTSEMKLMKGFRDKFGEPQHVVVCFGDWEQKQHRKYKEPVKGKGMRKLIRSWGYKQYLIWEHRTSLQCSGCKSDNAQTEKFYEITYCDDKGVSRKKKLHGLLKCKTCKRLWNRDANSSENIKCIGRSILNGSGRPDYLCRKPMEASEVQEIQNNKHGNVGLACNNLEFTLVVKESGQVSHSL